MGLKQSPDGRLCAEGVVGMEICRLATARIGLVEIEHRLALSLTMKRRWLGLAEIARQSQLLGLGKDSLFAKEQHLMPVQLAADLLRQARCKRLDKIDAIDIGPQRPPTCSNRIIARPPAP